MCQGDDKDNEVKIKPVKVKKWNAVAFWAYGMHFDLLSVNPLGALRRGYVQRTHEHSLSTFFLMFVLCVCAVRLLTADIENDVCAICHNQLMVPCTSLLHCSTAIAQQ